MAFWNKKPKKSQEVIQKELEINRLNTTFEQHTIPFDDIFMVVDKSRWMLMTVNDATAFPGIIATVKAVDVYKKSFPDSVLEICKLEKGTLTKV